MNKSKILITLTVAAAIGSIGAAPGYAFTLTGTSASFDNARLSNGKTVGRAETNDTFSNYEQAAFENSSDNYVEFFDYNGVSQVRWGDPAYDYYSSSKTAEGGHNKIRDNGGHYDKHDNYENDWHRDRTALKSGLGFAGVNDLNLNVGEVFNIGTLKHYNNTIWGGTTGAGRDATKADFSLQLDFGDSGIGQQKFNFALNVDETNNSASDHAGGACPYETTGNGCSDKITWDFALNAANSFDYEGDKYTLELVGFNDTPNFDASALNKFISQEGGTSDASLFARLVKLDKPTPPPSESVPEPGALAALGVIGLLLGKVRRTNEESLSASV